MTTTMVKEVEAIAEVTATTETGMTGEEAMIIGTLKSQPWSQSIDLRTTRACKPCLMSVSTSTKSQSLTRFKVWRIKGEMSMRKIRGLGSQIMSFNHSSRSI